MSEELTIWNCTNCLRVGSFQFITYSRIHEESYCEKYLRQPCSSLPSLQSGIPSHLYVSWIHCLRSEHLNCEAEQVMGGQPSSSWLSKQSLSPSHTQDCGMQCPERGHVNCEINTENWQLIAMMKKYISLEILILNLNDVMGSMFHQQGRELGFKSWLRQIFFI